MFSALFPKASALSTVKAPGPHTGIPLVTHAPEGMRPDSSFQRRSLNANSRPGVTIAARSDSMCRSAPPHPSPRWEESESLRLQDGACVLSKSAISHCRANASKFGRHNSPLRAPTRGAPTNCQSFSAKKPASSRQRPLEFATVHYDLHSSRRFALGRAPTRGAPTDCLLSAFCPGKGTHKGCPYRLSSLGVLPWGGHPQGVPLPIVFSRRFALGRAPTRGAPTDCLLSAFCPGKGLGRAPTRGAPTDCFLSAFCPGKGTHKGCPYRLSSLGVLP